jgi:N-acetylmuramoyl-L-alanine amidase
MKHFFRGHRLVVSVFLGIACIVGVSACAAPASAFVFDTTLAPGGTSSDVTALQTLLTEQGFYTGPITGHFGLLTTTAVKQFQKAHGISPLGIVGPASRVSRLSTRGILV